jgi:CHAT domain-containing protein
LHAAAPSDEFIHSYTKNLEYILNANSRKDPSHPLTIGVVGATGGKNFPLLRGVEQEVTKIRSILAENANYLTGEQATMEAVKLQLQNCSWIHLAGHGSRDVVDPLKSRVQLHDSPLELENILHMNLPNADFAFLTSCETFTGESGVPDIVEGFISAGFKGVIGTMWSIHDDDGPLIAETFYTHLFANGRKPQASDAAKALQITVRKMRNEGLPYERWAPLVHMGI